MSARGVVSAGMTPEQVSDLIDGGAAIDISDLPQHYRTALAGVKPGLRLHFAAPISRLDTLVVQAVAHAVPDSDCRAAEFASDGRWVRLEASDPADLEAVAEALRERLWEQEAESATALVPFADVMPGAKLAPLSVLVDKGTHVELWGLDPHGKSVKLEEWPLETTPAKALTNLLRAMFDVASLERWATLALPADLVHFVNFNAALGPVVFELVEAIRQHGRVDLAFFIELSRERPRRHPDVAYVASLWGIELPATLVIDHR